MFTKAPSSALMPYLPAFLGLLFVARWLEEKPDSARRPTAMKSRKIVRLCHRAGVDCGRRRGLDLAQEQSKARRVPASRQRPIPGSIKMSFDLPAHVLDFTSTNEAAGSDCPGHCFPKTPVTPNGFTQTTNGFWVNANIILMGMDRTSIHKPDFCLPGQGWNIDQKRDRQHSHSRPDIPITCRSPNGRSRIPVQNTDGQEAGSARTVRILVRRKE